MRARQDAAGFSYNITQQVDNLETLATYTLSAYAADSAYADTSPNCTIQMCAGSSCGTQDYPNTSYSFYAYTFTTDDSESELPAIFSFVCSGPTNIGVDNLALNPGPANLGTAFQTVFVTESLIKTISVVGSSVAVRTSTVYVTNVANSSMGRTAAQTVYRNVTLGNTPVYVTRTIVPPASTVTIMSTQPVQTTTVINTYTLPPQTAISIKVTDFNFTSTEIDTLTLPAQTTAKPASTVTLTSLVPAQTSIVDSMIVKIQTVIWNGTNVTLTAPPSTVGAE